MRPTLRMGSRGDDVRVLQTALNGHGDGTSTLLSKVPIDVDGVFGTDTYLALQQFQARHNLEVDGICGPASWAELLSPGTGLGVLAPESTPERERLIALAIEAEATDQALKLLRAAIRDLGAREVPDGSNRGPDIAHLVEGYSTYWRIPKRPYYAWCAMAIGQWWRLAFELGPWPRDAWAGSPPGALDGHPLHLWLGGPDQMQELATKESRWVKESPAPGDVFFVGQDPEARASHVGLVVAAVGAEVHTIEANVSNSVATKVRAMSALTFARFV